MTLTEYILFSCCLGAAMTVYEIFDMDDTGPTYVSALPFALPCAFLLFLAWFIPGLLVDMFLLLTGKE